MNLNTVIKARNFNLPSTYLQIHLLESADSPGHLNAWVLTGSQVFRNPLTPSIARMDPPKIKTLWVQVPPFTITDLIYEYETRENFSEINCGDEIPSVPEKNIPYAFFL